MCENCGCGSPGEKPVGIGAQHDEPVPPPPGGLEPSPGHQHVHDHEHEHEHDHEHGPGQHHGEAHGLPHSHPHGHAHAHPHSGEETDHAPAPGAAAEARRTLEVRRAILERNDRLAERNRGFFRARGLLVLNVLSAPGSGKTLFLRETVRGLAGRLRAGVIVGDLATDNDAQRLRETGAPVVQITTGTVCHLEAEMVGRAVEQLEVNRLELLIIENVGNLVCPAAYDLGEDLRVVLLSVTEGEDKPLKYPPMFQSADVVIVSKVDLAEACAYDRAVARANLQRVAPRARLFDTDRKSVV